jgi:hypothetical protein
VVGQSIRRPASNSSSHAASAGRWRRGGNASWSIVLELYLRDSPASADALNADCSAERHSQHRLIVLRQAGAIGAAEALARDGL